MLVVVIDDAERVTLGSDGRKLEAIFDILLRWAEDETDPALSRLRQLVSISPERAWILRPAPFRSDYLKDVSNRIDLFASADFTAEQVQERAAIHGLDWAGDRMPEGLTAEIGGHPRLVQLVVEAAAAGRAVQDVLQDDSVFKSFIDRRVNALRNNRVLCEALAHITARPCARPEDPTIYRQLMEAGLVVELAEGQCKLPYGLYERITREL